MVGWPSLLHLGGWSLPPPRPGPSGARTVANRPLARGRPWAAAPAGAARAITCLQQVIACLLADESVVSLAGSGYIPMDTSSEGGWRMVSTVWATVRNGRIEPVEPVELSEGSTVLVTLLGSEEHWFWQQAARLSLDAIWGNPEDEVYAQLLAK